MSAPCKARAASQDAEDTDQHLPAFRLPSFFVARVSEAKPGGGDEAAPSSPDIASLIRATNEARTQNASRGRPRASSPACGGGGPREARWKGPVSRRFVARRRKFSSHERR